MNDSARGAADGAAADPPEDAAVRARAEADAAAAAHPTDPPSPGTGVADAGETHAADDDEQPGDAGPKSTEDLKDELLDKASDELDQIGKFLSDALEVSMGAVEAKATSLVANSHLMGRALNYVPSEYRTAASDVVRTSIAGELPAAGHLVTDEAKKGLVLGLGWVKAHLRALHS